MKAIMYSTIAVVALAAVSPAEAGASKAEIEAAIRGFAAAGDRQDAAALDAVVHDGFRVVFRVAGSPDVTVLDRETYRGMLEAKKLGGSPREVHIDSVRHDGGLAYARVRMEREGARFDGVMTLVESGGEWKLIQDSTLFTPSK